jgi:hypothetical protein
MRRAAVIRGTRIRGGAAVDLAALARNAAVVASVRVGANGATLPSGAGVEVGRALVRSAIALAPPAAGSQESRE